MGINIAEINNKIASRDTLENAHAMVQGAAGAISRAFPESMPAPLSDIFVKLNVIESELAEVLDGLLELQGAWDGDIVIEVTTDGKVEVSMNRNFADVKVIDWRRLTNYGD